MKDTQRLIRNVLRALPAIPFIAPRRKTPIVPLLLGALGVAVIGGVAAVMMFSPRTRYRALDIARDRYGKVRGQLHPLAERIGIHGRANDLHEGANVRSYSSTGA